jgi:tRNA A-37 threonylcarbamoyl transferase component Bud32
MRNMKELLKHSQKYNKVIIQRQFDSKKNTVAYVTYNGKPRVFKWYAPAFTTNMQTEYMILTKAAGKLQLPTVFEQDTQHNLLIMNYILGENLCDILNNDMTPLKKKQHLIQDLAAWFAAFHTYFKTSDSYRIRGDSIPRNFIVTNKIWGVDFEESRIGKPIEDLATLSASLLTTDPLFTIEKYDLIRMFIKSYQNVVTWSLQDVTEEIAYALLERIQWHEDTEDLIRIHVTKIRAHGL